MAATRRHHGFDEVMIVNPYEPGTGPGRGATLMNMYGTGPFSGYYGQPFDAWGHYAEPDEFADGEEFAELEPMGETDEYGAPWDDAYAEYDPYGYYAEDLPLAGYAGYGQVDPYFGQADPYGAYAGYPPAVAAYPHMGYAPLGWYGEMPEMVGYGPYGAYEPIEEYPEIAYYAEPEFEGYVRDVPPRFNAGCPLPTNVAGYDEADDMVGYDETEDMAAYEDAEDMAIYDEADDLAAYKRPMDVSPTCQQFTEPAYSAVLLPDTLKPLW
jgi:hypothetical protein